MTEYISHVLSHISELGFIAATILIYIIFFTFRIKLQKIFAVPFSVISIIYLGFAAGVFFWIFYTNNSFNDLILFLSLIILIFYTYYTLQVVKSTYSAPALLQVQMSHSETLKLFLRKWLDEIKELPSKEEIADNSIVKYIDKYKSFEDRWQYRDLLDYHLPENYKDIQNDWNTLKDLVMRMETAKENLYNNIQLDIKSKIKTIKSFDQNIFTTHEDNLKYFSYLIYKICVSENNMHRLYDINLTIKNKQENLYHLMNSHSELLSSNSKEQLEKAKLELKLISDKMYLIDKYDDDLKEINHILIDLKNVQEKLQVKIEDLRTWTLLPGISCDRLKDFKPKL